MLINEIIKVYGYKPGLTLIGNEIIEWPYEAPLPSLEELNNLIESAAFQTTLKRYAENMDNIINNKAREKDYNDALSCASYVNSTNQNWKNESLAFIAWRDNCWQYAIDIQAQVIGGEIEPPTLEDFIANVPVINWN